MLSGACQNYHLQRNYRSKLKVLSPYQIWREHAGITVHVMKLCHRHIYQNLFESDHMNKWKANFSWLHWRNSEEKSDVIWRRRKWHCYQNVYCVKTNGTDYVKTENLEVSTCRTIVYNRHKRFSDRRVTHKANSRIERPLYRCTCSKWTFTTYTGAFQNLYDYRIIYITLWCLRSDYAFMAITWFVLCANSSKMFKL